MKILLVQTSFLGDVVLSTPVLGGIKLLYPNAELWTLTTPAAEQLFKFHPAVAGTLTFAKRGSERGLLGFYKKVRELRSQRFDIVYSLHRSARTALLLFAAGIKQRIGFSDAKLSFLYTDTRVRPKGEHDVVRNLSLLQSPEGSLVEQNQLQLFLPDAPRQFASATLRNVEAEWALGGEREHKGVIGIAPGSVWETKRWTASGFAEVAKQLIANGYSVVLLGGKDDEAKGREIIERSGEKLTNLIGRCSLLESVAVISSLRLLITNDSAPLHFASAMHIPTVAIFCSTSPSFGFGPWKNRAEIVEVNGLNCRPCARHGGHTCPTGTNACRLGITPKDVLAATFRLLEPVGSENSISAIMS
jgi:heptosyltransferase II